MRDVERKAARLVNSGAVEITCYTIHDGELIYAEGYVTSEHGRYTVTVQPDADGCDCTYGLNQAGRTHSHTAALRLAVWNLARQQLSARSDDART